MRPLTRRWAFVAACVLGAVGLIAGCVDQGALFGPPGSTRLHLVPLFSANGAAASDPIVRVRLVARDIATEQVVGTVDEEVDPQAEAWALSLPVAVSGESVSIEVTVEMLDAQGDVEWSGRIGPIVVDAGAAPGEPLEIPVGRGPLDNQSVTAVIITSADTTLTEGDTHTLAAAIEGGGAGAGVVWTSLDPTRATVSAAGTVTALLPTEGVAIEAAAGQHADTVHLGIAPRPAGIDFDPDSLVFSSIEQILTMHARVVDPRGDSIPGAAVTIAIEDSSIVDGFGGAQYISLAFGVTTLTATSVDAPEVSATARLRVVQEGGGNTTCEGGGTAHSGNIYADQTWSAAASPHHVNGSIVVDSGAVLVIEAGAIVCGAPGAGLYFQDSTRIVAVGTAGAPIEFLSTDSIVPWSGMVLQGAGRDTSRFANVRFEHVVAAVYADQGHVVFFEDAQIRATRAYALYLYGNGSRIERTTIRQNSGNNWIVATGDSALVRDLVIRDGIGSGLYSTGVDARFENVVIRDLDGAGMYLYDARNTIDGLRIENVGGGGFIAVGGEHIEAASGVRIVGAGSYGVQAGIGDVAALAPRPEDFDSLLGNAVDTILVYGGTLSHDTAFVRPDIPWRVRTTAFIDTTGVLSVMPGATLTFEGGGALYASAGGRIHALGTAAQPVRFVPADTADYWDGIFLGGNAISRFRHAYIERAEATGAIQTNGLHVLEMDSSEVHHSRYVAIGLYTAGSSVRNTLVDTTLTAGYRAVELRTNTVWENNVVRGAAGVGVGMIGNGIQFLGGRIEGSGSYGIESTSTTDTLAAVLTPRVVGGASYPVRLPLQLWTAFVPDEAALDSMLGNARDTAVIYGGTLRDIDMVVTPVLPLLFESTAAVDAGARLVVQPGVTLRFAQFAGITARNGGVLEIIGTEAQPIHLMPVDTALGWPGLVFQSAPADTSHLRHVVVHRGTSGSGAITATGSHVLEVDSSRIRQSRYYAVNLSSPGSRLAWSTVDTTREPAYASVHLAGGTHWISNTVRGAAGQGLRVTAAAATLSGGRIEGSGATGLEVLARPMVGSPIRVVGGAGYGASLDIGTFALLYSGPAEQDSLLGNARDTVVLNGGSTVNDTLTAGAALPWLLNTWTYLTDTTLVVFEPGARVAGVVNSQLYVQSGSTVRALGTQAQPVVFTSTNPALRWYGLSLEGTPTDTSFLRHVLIENASDADGGVAAHNAHVLVMDSSRVRNSLTRAISIYSTGSVLRDVVIDTTQTPSSPSLYISGDSVVLQRGTIRRPAGLGLQITGSLHSSSVTPRIVAAQGYPAAVPVHAIPVLFPTRADQDSMLGNMRDTLSVTGGALNTGVALAGNSLPWRLENLTYIQNGGRLEVEPGATIAATENAQLLFQIGGTLDAVGTPDAPIRFTSTSPAFTWRGMNFAGSPTDTTRIVHAIVENTGPATSAIQASGNHVVLLDTIHVRNALHHGVLLTSAGSALRHSVVDTAGAPTVAAVQLGAGTSILGGVIRGAVGVALQITGTLAEPSTMPRIVGSGRYALRAPLADVQRFLADAGAYDSIAGNDVDTIAVTAGIVTSGTMVVPASTPWRIEGDLYFDTAAVLQPEPGASFSATVSGSLNFRHGGALIALGTETDTIRFTSVDPAARWTGLAFTGTLGGLSRLGHVLVENASSASGAIYAATSSNHVVQLDSVLVRNSLYRAVALGSRDSYIARSTVETTMSRAYPAVMMGRNTTFETTTVRGAAGFGLLLDGDSVFLNGGLITEGDSTGLAFGSVNYIAIEPEVLPTITGNADFPAQLTTTQLMRLAPGASDRSLWLGNDRDTLVIVAATHTTGRALVTVNLPWLLTGDQHFSGATAGLDVEPGSYIVSTSGADWYFQNGATIVALGTAAAPITFTGADTALADSLDWWGGFLLQGSTPDTSQFRHVLIQSGRLPGGQIQTSATHVVFADSIHIRESLEQAAVLAAPGSRLNYSTVETVRRGNQVTTLEPAVVLGANTQLIGSRVSGGFGDGVQITGNGVVLSGCEVSNNQGDGIEVTNAVSATTIQNCNLIGNGDNAPAAEYAIFWNGTGTGITATNNWWGTPGGPPGTNSGGTFSTAGGNIATTPVASAPFTIPAWTAP